MMQLQIAIVDVEIGSNLRILSPHNLFSWSHNVKYLLMDIFLAYIYAPRSTIFALSPLQLVPSSEDPAPAIHLPLEDMMLPLIFTSPSWNPSRMTRPSSMLH